MYSIACQVMGIAGCPFIAKSDTMEGAQSMLKEHGNTTHPDKIKEMMDGGMTEEMMMNKMKEVIKTE